MTEIEGFARCLNQQCDLFDEDRPVVLVKTVKEQRGDGPFKSTVITASEYVHAADDADLMCPECGQPCAMLPSKRRAVPVGTPMR